MMHRRTVRNLLSRRGFHLLLFVSAALLFQWPILSTFDHGPAGLHMLVYVFAVWTAVIVAIALVSRSLPAADADEPEEDR